MELLQAPSELDNSTPAPLATNGVCYLMEAVSNH